MKEVIFISSLLAILHGVFAFSEAPGDRDPRCRTLINEPEDYIFPEEWEVLIDTYDYFSLYNSLFGPSVWQERSFDGDGTSVYIFSIACSSVTMTVHPKTLMSPRTDQVPHHS